MHYIHTHYGYCYYEVDETIPGGGYLIYSLYVRKEHRRKGYARRMLQYLIDEIRGTGYEGDIYSIVAKALALGAFVELLKGE